MLIQQAKKQRLRCESEFTKMFGLRIKYAFLAITALSTYFQHILFPPSTHGGLFFHKFNLVKVFDIY